MEKYFFLILSVCALQRLNNNERRKENISTFRGLSLLQNSSLLHEKHHGASATTAVIRRWISAEVPTQRCRNPLEMGLVTLLFSLQSAFAFRLRNFWLLLGRADNDMPQVSYKNKTTLPFGSVSLFFCSKKTSLLVTRTRSSVTVNGQCSVEFLGLAVIYTTQRSCIPSKPLLCLLCTLFLNEIRYHDLENWVNKNRYGINGASWFPMCKNDLWLGHLVHK